MQNRIDRLEGLVLSLMGNGSAPETAQRALSMNSSSGSAEYCQDVEIYDSTTEGQPQGDESDTDQMVQSLGVMRVDNNKSMYFSDAHWAAVLSDVSRMPIPRDLANRVISPDLGGKKLLRRAQEAV